MFQQPFGIYVGSHVGIVIEQRGATITAKADQGKLACGIIFKGDESLGRVLL